MNEPEYPQPPTQEEMKEQRKADFKALSKLHPGNRFRLMFGMPLLPEGNGPVIEDLLP